MGSYQALKSIRLTRSVLLSLALWLAACRGAVTPAPTAPAATPPPGVPQDWIEHGLADFVIWLPPTWEAHAITAENAGDEFAAIEQVNPTLARTLGGPEVLQELDLWAFDAGKEAAGFHDNLNIGSASLGGERYEDLRPILEVLEQEYGRSGATVTDSRLYQANEQPALSVRFNFRTLGGEGQPATMEGWQYFFVAGEVIWILSFAIDPLHHDQMQSTIEACAGSFRAIN
jgi:hypothetical protein